MTVDWPAVEISEACELIIDCVNKTAPVVEGPTPYKMIRTTNVRDGWVDTANVRYVEQETYNTWIRRGAPQNGDVILTREAPLGEVGLLRDARGIFLGQRLVMYRADSKKLDNRFLLFTLLGHDLQGQIKAFGSGSTVEHMRVPDCGKLIIKLPPLETQRKIASILSTYDDLIENNTRRIKILEEMAQTIYREWFVNFRFPGHEKAKMVDSPLGKIPEGWEACTVKDVVELRYGKALKASDRKDGPFPVFGSSGVVGCHSDYLVKAPGIIVGRKGNVGSVHWSDIDFSPIDTAYYVKTGFSLFYVYYNFQHQNFINNDAAVPGLNRNQAYSLPFVKPSSQTLEAFDAFCAPLFKQLIALNKKNENLRQTRDMLLPKLISGTIDVSDLEIETKETAA